MQPVSRILVAQDSIGAAQVPKMRQSVLENASCKDVLAGVEAGATA